MGLRSFNLCPDDADGVSESFFRGGPWFLSQIAMGPLGLAATVAGIRVPAGISLNVKKPAGSYNVITSGGLLFIQE